MAVGDHGVILDHAHQRAVDRVHVFESGTALIQHLAKVDSTVWVKQSIDNLVTWKSAKTEVNHYSTLFITNSTINPIKYKTYLYLFIFKVILTKFEIEFSTLASFTKKISPILHIFVWVGYYQLKLNVYHGTCFFQTTILNYDSPNPINSNWT